MREIRTYGSEGGVAFGSFLPLCSVSLRSPRLRRPQWGVQSRLIQFTEHNLHHRKECDDRDLSVEPMELRSIDFEELYHQGWAIEKGYKLDESRLEFERWRGKSVHAVEQDFYGRMLLVTLSACLASVAESLVAVKTEKCEHHYQVNQT
jgi:IS4 transposase